MIAALKFKTFAWQDEYRLVFSLTNALAFENAQYALVRNGSSQQPNQQNINTTILTRETCTIFAESMSLKDRRK